MILDAELRGLVTESDMAEALKSRSPASIMRMWRAAQEELQYYPKMIARTVDWEDFAYALVFWLLSIGNAATAAYASTAEARPHTAVLVCALLCAVFATVGLAYAGCATFYEAFWPLRSRLQYRRDRELLRRAFDALEVQRITLRVRAAKERDESRVALLSP